MSVDIARARGFPWAGAAVGIAAALAAFPFLPELPIYLEFARGLAAGRHIPSDLPMTWAVGYPLLLGPFVRIADVAGVVARCGFAPFMRVPSTTSARA